jgi:hypothetical protein
MADTSLQYSISMARERGLRKAEQSNASARGELAVASVSARLARLDWKALERELWTRGHAVTEPILTATECRELVALYPHAQHFRKTIDMAARRFGLGDYKYFKYPLPSVVQSLRVRLYPRLARIANGWMEALGARERYPATLREFLARCHQHGQTRPTPLLLHYEAGGYNCLHQDLYGPLAFPLQVTAFLSKPSEDYRDGAFLLLEQRPRAQSMCDALMPEQGALVLFPSRIRPEPGKLSYHRVQLKHGVSRVRAGSRYTLGIIFHDAK